MKRLLALALLAASSAFALDATLLWDASITPGVSNYTVFGRAVSLGPLTTSNRFTSVIVVNAGTNTQALLTGISVTPFYFGVTCTKDGLTSDFSNIIIVGQPMPPSNVRLGP